MDDSFTAVIEVSQEPEHAFDRIKEVSNWWGGPDLAGETTKVGDEFTIIHGDAHYSKQRVVELTPHTKIVWLVTESNLSWLSTGSAEWTGTRMIFEISPHKGSTRITFTHEGLTPRKESYVRCAEGWKLVISEWLFNFIAEGVSHFKHGEPPSEGSQLGGIDTPLRPDGAPPK